MYEKRSGRVSLPAGYYMGYQGAFLVGILVLFLGGIINGHVHEPPGEEGKA